MANSAGKMTALLALAGSLALGQNSSSGSGFCVGCVDIPKQEPVYMSDDRGMSISPLLPGEVAARQAAIKRVADAEAALKKMEEDIARAHGVRFTTADSFVFACDPPLRPGEVLVGEYQPESGMSYFSCSIESPDSTWHFEGENFIVIERNK